MKTPRAVAPAKCESTGSDFYECVLTQCEAAGAEKRLPRRGTVSALNLPWRTSLFAGSSVRERIGEPLRGFLGPPHAVSLSRGLPAETARGYAPHVVYLETNLEGQLGRQTGHGFNGVSASKPCALRFEEKPAGALNSKATGAGTYTGSIKYLGYNI